MKKRKTLTFSTRAKASALLIVLRQALIVVSHGVSDPPPFCRGRVGGSGAAGRSLARSAPMILYRPLANLRSTDNVRMKLAMQRIAQ